MEVGGVIDGRHAVSTVLLRESTRTTWGSKVIGVRGVLLACIAEEGVNDRAVGLTLKELDALLLIPP